MSHYHLPHHHGQNIERVLERMPPPDAFQMTAATFQQLGDPTRLRILWLLEDSGGCLETVRRRHPFQNALDVLSMIVGKMVVGHCIASISAPYHSLSFRICQMV